MPITNISNIAPSYQQFLTAGSFTYYPTFAFLCTAAFSVTPTAGATYTNNSATFTVTQVVGNYLYGTSSGVPSTSGTLTKSTGTGDASISFIGFYQPKKLRARGAAGGGGGGGSGNPSGGNGSAGGSTTFGGTLIVATGGGAGKYNAVPDAPGTATLGVGAVGSTFTGTFGSGSGITSTPNTAQYGGGTGGNSALFGGGGGGGTNNAAGIAATANTGGGGSGAGSGSLGAVQAGGSGGSSGGSFDVVINGPLASSYAVVIGASGTAGAAGANGFIGGIGSVGALYIEESYVF